MRAAAKAAAAAIAAEVASGHKQQQKQQCAIDCQRQARRRRSETKTKPKCIALQAINDIMCIVNRRKPSTRKIIISRFSVDMNIESDCGWKKMMSMEEKKKKKKILLRILNRWLSFSMAKREPTTIYA